MKKLLTSLFFLLLGIMAWAQTNDAQDLLKADPRKAPTAFIAA